MNTTVESPTKTEYLYVKDLPDVGGLRARRMKALRTDVEMAVHRGMAKAWVFQRGSRIEVLGTTSVASCVFDRTDPALREVYDLTRDLAPQFAERRALHW